MKLLMTLLSLLGLFEMCGAENIADKIDHHVSEFLFNSSGPGYETWCIGNCQNGVTTTTQPVIMMMGGGSDVDEAFEYMIESANGGDFFVLRTSGDDAYNRYIYRMGGVNSVTTILITSRVGAQQPYIADLVRGAEAIFMAGGDQSTYISYWADTPLSDAMDHCINTKGIPLGGTSAGLHVLGEFIYTGERGSAVSDECLDNPYNVFVTLANGFLRVPFLENLVTDSHFYERDRMGRSITFLARLIQDGFTRPGLKGISVDEATALLVGPKGTGHVVGDGYAYFFEATENPTDCERGVPLTFYSVYTYKMDSGSFNGIFDLVTWAGVGGRGYYIDAIDGEMESTQPGGSVY